jgi:hypothetical protein
VRELRARLARFCIRRCAWLVAVGFGAVFWIARLGTLPVFDDTSYMLRLGPGGGPTFGEVPRPVGEIVARAFAELSSSGYRPLSRIIADLGVEYAGSGRVPLWLWALGVAVLFGATAGVFFWVARMFTWDRRLALMATSLFMCCAPLLGASWVLWAGIQVTVPLLIAAGLGTYLRAVRDERSPRWCAAVLGVVLFFGPWF